MTNPICYVMVGLPASGKSTRVKNMCDMDLDAFVYSTDNYIEQCAKVNGWTYDQAFSEFIDPATKHMNEMLDIAIRSKQNIIWDQTNTGAGKRKRIINRMKQAGYIVECECYLPPETVEDIAEWNSRLHNRPGKTIPDHVIENMVKTFVVPTLDEGFDKINFWNIYGVLLNIKETNNA